jgi:ADP-ribose pyrophosphatase
MYAYLATDLSESPLSPDEDELIQVVPANMRDIPDMIRSGSIQDGKSIAAILMAMHIYQESL